jgi:hypothetical protein
MKQKIRCHSNSNIDNKITITLLLKIDMYIIYTYHLKIKHWKRLFKKKIYIYVLLTTYNKIKIYIFISIEKYILYIYRIHPHIIYRSFSCLFDFQVYIKIVIILYIRGSFYIVFNRKIKCFYDPLVLEQLSNIFQEVYMRYFFFLILYYYLNWSYINLRRVQYRVLSFTTSSIF